MNRVSGKRRQNYFPTFLNLPDSRESNCLSYPPNVANGDNAADGDRFKSVPISLRYS